MKRNCEKRRQNRITCEDTIPLVYGCQQSLFEAEPVIQKEEREEKSAGNYVFDIVDALTAPILTFSQSWADTIPKRLLDIIQMARLKALMLREETATYAEGVVYIYTRSLEAPMDSGWTDIYTHITCKTLEEWFGEDHWNETKAPKELSDWLSSKLNDLLRHIYIKRRKMLKERFKEHDKTEKEVVKTGTKQPGNPQQSLPYI